MSEIAVLFTGGTEASVDVEALARKGIRLDLRRADLDEHELGEALREVDAYILGGVETATAKALTAASRLKVIAFLGVGYHAFVDTEAASTAGIAVTNAPGANARAVAEFTVGLLVGAWRQVTHLAVETKAGRWPQHTGRNLGGKTLGVVGLGTIGTMVARMAVALGMRVVYTSRTAKPEAEREFGAERLPLDELLARADAITLHTAYGPETHGMLDTERLDLVKPGAVLVNTSEAELVDPVALREALLAGKLAASAFDGYYIEPVPGPEDDPHGLLALPDAQFLVTPHTANATEESFEAMLAANVSSILNLLGSGHDPHVVNPDFRDHAAWL